MFRREIIAGRNWIRCVPTRARAKLVAFARANRGVAAVEFGIIAVPFIGLLFATFQTSVVLFAAQILESATENAARQIMTGQAQSAGLTAANFRDLVCPPTSGGTSALPRLIDCTKLVIDVRVASSFSSTDTSKTIFSTPAQAQFNPGGPGTVNVVRVLYQLPPYLSILGGVNNIFGMPASGGMTNVIMGTSVFQTEPYSS